MKSKKYGTTSQRREAAKKYIDGNWQTAFTTAAVRRHLVKKFGMAIDNNVIRDLITGRRFVGQATNEIRRPYDCRPNCPSHCGE